MTDCLLCAATEIERGSWMQVQYNSARSDETKTKSGKVVAVEIPRRGDQRVVIEREDRQKMSIYEDDRVVSHGSWYPVTGYYYNLEIKQ